MQQASERSPNNNLPFAALGACLAALPVLALRLELDTPGVRAHIPMLRGVWGAALRGLDPQIYDEVFAGGVEEAEAPGYLMRPACPRSGGETALEFLLLGRAPLRLDACLRAWDVASGMGLGPERRRFHIREVRPLDSNGEDAGGFEPRPVRVEGVGAEACVLHFTSPTRIIRRKRLVESPTTADLVAAGLRRLGGLLDPAHRELLACVDRDLVAAAKQVASATLNEHPLDLVRWSGRQQAEIAVCGVVFDLELPDGPGAFAPLLAALSEIHVGKGTVFGMGGFEIETLA